MQISFSEAEPLLQTAIARDLAKVGSVGRHAVADYVKRKFNQPGGSFLTLGTNFGALADLRLLEWDSQIYGAQIGAAAAFFLSNEVSLDTQLLTSLASELVAHAKERKMKMLIARVSVNNLAWIQALEETGFQIMDVQCPLVSTLAIPNPDGSRKIAQVQVRAYEASDLSELLDLAKEAFGQSHLYADSRLPIALTDRLYEEWTRNDCAGRARFVLVAVNGKNVIGFVAGVWKDEEEDLLGLRHGHIDLIAVKSNARRMGVARRLMNEAMARYVTAAADVVTVSTQGSNLAAISLYQRLGFTMQGLEITLHGWLEPG